MFVTIQPMTILYEEDGIHVYFILFVIDILVS